MFSVHNLTKSFGGLLANEDISFEIEKGRIAGIIGPNGAGKTTLFNLITGIFAPDRGHVKFNGAYITGKKPNQIASLGIARTFQLVKPFGDLTVEQNVMMGALPRHRSFAEAGTSARKVIGMLELTPYQAEKARSLPIGLKKKLELARALATQPSLLFLDEIMGGLTPREVKDMIELIGSLNRDQGITVCMIEHVMTAVMALSEKIIVLQQGRKLAEGAPQEIISNQEVIEAYLGGEIIHAKA